MLRAFVDAIPPAFETERQLPHLHFEMEHFQQDSMVYPFVHHFFEKSEKSCAHDIYRVILQWDFKKFEAETFLRVIFRDKRRFFGAL